MSFILILSSIETLFCPSCSKQQDTKSTFINLSIDLPDNVESLTDLTSNSQSNSSINLLELFKLHLEQEELDDDNKWHCDGCSQLVNAKKAQSYEKLPERLVVHLKRFRFDPVSDLTGLNLTNPVM